MSSSGSNDLYFLFFLWMLAYFIIFEIDFVLITCFPLRAYRLGLKGRKYYRTKELYHDVIEYFAHRCTCCNFAGFCTSDDPDCGCFNCLKVLFFFTFGIFYWILLIPFLMLPLGCDCIYECELRSRYPFKRGDFCYDCHRGDDDDNDAQVMQSLGNDEGITSNNNDAQIQNQKQDAVQGAQPYISDQAPQYPQNPVYQQSSPYVSGPIQAQQNQAVPVYQQSNPYASGPIQAQQNQAAPVVDPYDNPYV